jgi:phenylacetate-coenzyme A ligase PaaK-like adenylate-forming protein
MLAAMPEFVTRLAWTRQEIELQRRRALRLLLRVAAEYSPWHRERLRGIDPGRATEADLAAIPPMTRDDLMDHWDEIVIYPAVRLGLARKHLREMKDDAYLLDGFHASRAARAGAPASSSTTGTPGPPASPAAPAGACATAAGRWRRCGRWSRR